MYKPAIFLFKIKPGLLEIKILLYTFFFIKSLIILEELGDFMLIINAILFFFTLFFILTFGSLII